MEDRDWKPGCVTALTDVIRSKATKMGWWMKCTSSRDSSSPSGFSQSEIEQCSSWWKVHAALIFCIQRKTSWVVCSSDCKKHTEEDRSGSSLLMACKKLHASSEFLSPSWHPPPPRVIIFTCQVSISGLAMTVTNRQRPFSLNTRMGYPLQLIKSHDMIRRDFVTKLVCVGTRRILQGSPELIGKQSFSADTRYPPVSFLSG